MRLGLAGAVLPQFQRLRHRQNVHFGFEPLWIRTMSTLRGVPRILVDVKSPGRGNHETHRVRCHCIDTRFDRRGRQRGQGTWLHHEARYIRRAVAPHLTRSHAHQQLVEPAERQSLYRPDGNEESVRAAVVSIASLGVGAGATYSSGSHMFAGVAEASASWPQVTNVDGSVDVGTAASGGM